MKNTLIIFTLFLGVACTVPEEQNKSQTIVEEVHSSHQSGEPYVAQHKKVEDKLCEVVVCNKIKRFSLDPIAHLKDKIGETCFSILLPESSAKEGHVLSNESKWWQGRSINFTKKSVTTVKQVVSCQ